MKSKSGAKSHGIQKKTLNLKRKKKCNYRMITRLCLGSYHRLWFSCFVSARGTATWLRYHESWASSRLCKSWLYPSGPPLRASMAVKFAKASL